MRKTRRIAEAKATLHYELSSWFSESVGGYFYRTVSNFSHG